MTRATSAANATGSSHLAAGARPELRRLIIESHCDPDSALSDAAQQVTPEVLDYTLQLLVVRDNAQTTENISILRRQIDEVDEQLLSLLAKRMHISQEIGTYKKEHNNAQSCKTSVTMKSWTNAAKWGNRSTSTRNSFRKS